MTNKVEAATIRSQLKLRMTPTINSKNLPDIRYEVWTTIHGSGIFKWILIDEVTYNWYKNNFKGIKEELFNEKTGNTYNN